MSKNKEWEAWMQGAVYASNIVAKEGIEGLKKEMQRRNITKITSKVNQNELLKSFSELGDNIYVNVLTVTCYVLKDTFGFGEKRLKQFRDSFDQATQPCLDLDYLGERYVSMVDYARQMNEEYHLGIDIERVERVAEVADYSDSRYHKVDLEGLIKDFRRVGMNDAADYLENKAK